MSSSSNSKFLLGLFIGILATIFGGLGLSALQNFWKEEPNLSWFHVSDVYLPDFYLDKVNKNNPEAMDFNSRSIYSIVIDNSGHSAAQDVVILIDDVPVGVSIDPPTGISESKTANGLYRISIENIDANSQVKLNIIGSYRINLKKLLMMERKLKTWY